MKTFEIKDKEVFKKIKQNIKKRKEKNEGYNDDLNRFDREIFIKKIEGLNKDSDNLLFISNPKYYPEREISSHRKFIGPLIVKIRELIYDEIRMSYDPILYNQYNFNNSILNVLERLLKIEMVIENRKKEDFKDIKKYFKKKFGKEKRVVMMGGPKLDIFPNIEKNNLNKIEDRSLNGLIIWNMVEKIGNKEILEMLNIAYLKLKKDKFLIINSTNPENLSNFSSEYYKKSINPKILHQEVFKFILESLEFRNIKVKYYSPDRKLRRLKNSKENE